MSRLDLVPLGLSIFLGGVALSFSNASASEYNAIYSFPAASGPYYAPLIAANGDIFGAQRGSLYQLHGNSNGVWREKVLCDQTNCLDGDANSRLIMDTAGNLYGLTATGGDANQGTIFELMAPVPGRKHWRLKALLSFGPGEAPQNGGGLTYAGAASGQLYDGSSPLFGATPFGGSCAGGMVFELYPHGNKWKEKVLHSFCTYTKDGNEPNAPLVVDSSGDLFGTTYRGGADDGNDDGDGTIFELLAGNYHEIVLHRFCPKKPLECHEGGFPAGPLVPDGNGNFFGTTSAGGPNSPGGSTANCCGTIFELKNDGTVTTLYGFCSQPNCADGSSPWFGLVRDGQGNLFGEALALGGGTPYGGIFEFSNGTEQIIHYACSEANCADGNPDSGLTIDAAGNVFGTTDEAIQPAFTLFEITPSVSN